jgi:uracil phosphoribosyltransferase
MQTAENEGSVHDTDTAAGGVSGPLNLVSHPLVQHKLTLMREASCPASEFRRLLREIAMLLCCEVTRDLPLAQVPIATPLEPMMAPRIAGPKLVLAPVLRAGLGMLEGMLELLPAARVAHIGLYRDPATLQAVEYYFKAPPDLAERLVLVLDPMFATGHSAVAAVDRLKGRGCRAIRFVSLLAAPEGLAHFHARHPDVPVWTAAVDRELDEHHYIRPGLGDAGDRLWGTR